MYPFAGGGRARASSSFFTLTAINKSMMFLKMDFYHAKEIIFRRRTSFSIFVWFFGFANTCSMSVSTLDYVRDFRSTFNMGVNMISRGIKFIKKTIFMSPSVHFDEVNSYLNFASICLSLVA